VSRQLKQMTDFIRQEAVEKAVEIEAAAAEVSLSPPFPRTFFSRGSPGLDLVIGRRDPRRADSDLVRRGRIGDRAMCRWVGGGSSELGGGSGNAGGLWWSSWHAGLKKRSCLYYPTAALCSLRVL